MPLLPFSTGAADRRPLDIPFEATEAAPAAHGPRPRLRWWKRRGGASDEDTPAPRAFGPRRRLGVLLACAALAAAGILAARALLVGPAAPPATLTITSEPPGATILIDGERKGTTPATVATRAGERRIALRLAGYGELAFVAAAEAGRVVPLRGDLWRAVPQVRRIRTPLPGTALGDVDFLADGRLALTVLLPPNEERQAWVVEASGAMRRIGPPAARGALAVAPGGDRVAWLAEPAPAGEQPRYPGRFRPTEVRIGPAEGGDPGGSRAWTLPAGAPLEDEYLVDLRWAPGGDGLLVVAQGDADNGGTRFRLLWLDLDSGAIAVRARELVILPSEVVPGSYAWRADGGQVAFLTRGGGRTALCLLGTERDGTPPLFRYLADVTGEGGNTTPFPPIAWEPAGGRVAYAAPLEPAPSGWAGVTRATVLLVDDLSGQPGIRLAEGAGAGPLWRADGAILTFTRLKSGQAPLVRRLGPGAGTAAASGEAGTASVDGEPLPLPAANPDGARWDRARPRAVVALRPPGGTDGYEFWLVDWR